MNRLVPIALALSTVFSAAPAGAATYAINQINYIDPGTSLVAPYTTLWGNNNNGKVIGQASYDATGATGAFPFIYDPATGAFTRLAPPIGVDPSKVAAISINDADEITGSIFDAVGGVQGFIWRAGVYSYFSNPAFDTTTPRTMSNHTALHPQGLVVGYNEHRDPVSGLATDSAGFLYDPVANVSATITGTASSFTIAQGLNIAGQAVGHVTTATPGTERYQGFLYTPSGADPMAGGSVTTFQVNGFGTKARGINDHGILAAAVYDTPGTGSTNTYVATSLGYQLVSIPSAVGPVCPDGNWPGSFPEGLNNAGQITGILFDNAGACATHGFIATPSYVPTGTTPSGAYTFAVDVVPNTPYFLDPAVAIGYDFEIGKKNPLFATVRLPLGIGNNKFVLVVGHKSYSLNAGELFDFRTHGHKKGVKGFRVACIDPAAQLDPVNSLAFPTEVTFANAGKFTGTQQPLTKMKFHGRDLAKLTQAECRQRILGADDGEGPDAD
jgi:hypothetical protein